MTDLIQRIVAAIIRQEGMAASNTNPGNLRAAPWAAHPVIVSGFWRPATRQEGIAGLAHLVALRIAQGYSLAQLISSYAPASDHNRTDIYMRNVADWAKINDVNAPLWNLLS